jgi:uncharacterized protein YqgC (DUF456 family)
VSTDTLLIVLVAIIMVVGVAGTVLPILPGLWLVWAGAIVYGVFGGFGTVGWIATAVITLVAVVGTAAALYLPHRKASEIGIPWWGQALALGLSVAGFFFIPVVGAPVGFVVGILVTSLVRLRSIPGALDSTWSTLKSMLMASGLQLAASLVMVSTWVVWVWAG